MKRKAMVVFMAAFLATTCTIPAFAHCHGRNRHYSCEGSGNYAVCEANCEDGYQCGVDGHYCELHRDGDCCTGQVADGYTYSRGHHHH
ncbi:MAG: hypothetical protein HFG60_02640 [Lachnospiraceae bacterium]|nr:hypothetical protein [Lachnospiraceae bacterium]MCI9183743.1 hypothetical protein [Lachnospiraceae bacterium]